MKRREFAFTFSAATFALLNGCGVLPNLGKPATFHVARVGILDGSAADDPIPNDKIAGLKQGLAELGYVDGQTVVFELRGADSNFARLPELANELIQLPVDVLVCTASPETLVARQATTVVPIVFNATDPVGRGFVASLL
jgi:putative ABC transport system substrate-binding protein